MSYVAEATPPIECWRLYKKELLAGKRGAITRTVEQTTGHSYQNLRKLLLLFNQDRWEPVLHAQPGVEGYYCILPNSVTVTVLRHYYVKGIITGKWWHLHWPTDIDPIDPTRVINLVHQIDTLKDARILLYNYIDNDYTVPEGAWRGGGGGRSLVQ